ETRMTNQWRIPNDEKEREVVQRRLVIRIFLFGFDSSFVLRISSFSSYAPYLPRRPALASASSMRYLASNWPRPPRTDSRSLNSWQESLRQHLLKSNVGTGCQLWLRNR